MTAALSGTKAKNAAFRLKSLPTHVLDDPKNVSVPSFCRPYNVSSRGEPNTENGQFFIRLVVQLSPVSKKMGKAKWLPPLYV